MCLHIRNLKRQLVLNLCSLLLLELEKELHLLLQLYITFITDGLKVRSSSEAGVQRLNSSGLGCCSSDEDDGAYRSLAISWTQPTCITFHWENRACITSSNLNAFIAAPSKACRTLLCSEFILNILTKKKRAWERKQDVSILRSEAWRASDVRRVFGFSEIWTASWERTGPDLF